MSGPTPYPDVNAALADLHAGALGILGEQFCGMYLSGSLALGDFAAERSDIDYVVATDQAISRDHLHALRAMHARFNASDSPWATEVEAAYIPQGDLRRYDPARSYHPHIERGAAEVLDLDQLDSGWVIQRWILRERGVVVAGPDPRTLIDSVPPDNLRRAVRELMDDWWGPMRDDPAPLYRHAIGYQAYAVLTMCRICYTLARGAVVSKPAAARWAQAALDARFTPLIARALAWRKDRQDVPSDDDLHETFALIECTVARCRPPTGERPLSR